MIRAQGVFAGIAIALFTLLITAFIVGNVAQKAESPTPSRTLPTSARPMEL